METKLDGSTKKENFQQIGVKKETYYLLKENAAKSKLKFYEYMDFLANQKIVKK